MMSSISFPGLLSFKIVFHLIIQIKDTRECLNIFSTMLFPIFMFSLTPPKKNKK